MYSIKAVSQATGLSIETLRAWERRYQIVEPERDPNGRRAYRPDDVIRLRKLREATERGHPISRLARLRDGEIEEILGTPAAPSSAAATVPAAGAPGRNFVTQMIAAAEDYRPADCDQLLAMSMALMPLDRVVSEVLSPVLTEVGERWHRGDFAIAQERIVSSSVRRQLSSVLDTYARVANGPIMVLSTPSGERHDLGILMCALLAASRNVRCHYLGPDLPVEELATYASRVGADVVALSVLNGEDIDLLLEQLHRLDQFLPERIELWGGGKALTRASPNRLPPRLKLLDDLTEFERQLGLLPARFAS